MSIYFHPDEKSPSVHWPWSRWLAHRGGGVGVLENTISGFMKGIAAGAQMMECDVRLSRDAIPLLLHDDVLNGVGAVRNLDWDTLLQKAVIHPASQEKIPSLEAILMFCVDHQLAINIEIKPHTGDEQATTQAIAQVIRKKLCTYPSLENKILISSFAYESLHSAKTLLPNIPRSLLTIDISTETLRHAQDLQAIAIHAWDGRIYTPHIHQVINAGLALMVYTVNDADRARWLFQQGVTAICTDNLSLIKSTIN